MQELNYQDSSTVQFTGIQDACLDFTLRSGKRYCTCKCSKVCTEEIWKLATSNNELYSSKDNDGDRNTKKCAEYNPRTYNDNIEDFEKCKFSAINIEIELLAFLYTTFILFLFIAGSVFKELHDAHTALYHSVDPILPMLMFHAKFHDSRPIVDGTIVFALIIACVKIVYIINNIVRVAPGCNTFEPCAEQPVLFISFLGVSSFCVLLNAVAVRLLYVYRRMLHRCSRYLQKSIKM